MNTQKCMKIISSIQTTEKTKHSNAAVGDEAEFLKVAKNLKLERGMWQSGEETSKG